MESESLIYTDFVCLFVSPFILFLFLLYNIILVLPYINMNPPQIYKCSPSWTTLSSLPIPSLWVVSVHQSLFLWVSCSWQSEGFFGQSLCIALPIQALRELPCLGSFSVVQRIRHIEGPPWLRSYFVDQDIRHLKGHPGHPTHQSKTQIPPQPVPPIRELP